VRAAPPRSDAQRLADMLQAIRRIRELTDLPREEFARNAMAQEAVAFQLMVLGEASERISKRTKNVNRTVPWRALSDLRWAFAHAYFETDLTSTWGVVRRELNGIERKLRRARVGPPPE